MVLWTQYIAAGTPMVGNHMTTMKIDMVNAVKESLLGG